MASDNLALKILISAKDTASGALRGLQRVMGDLRTQIAAVAASLGLVRVGTDALREAGAVESLEARFVALEGSAEAARAKLAELEGAFGLRQVAEARTLYAEFSTFGLKPTVEQLKALIDFNARTGRGIENLRGITLQLSQAWGKQKLQYEDIIILMERGVPVWDLLAKATGRTTAQLHEMGSKGELGRDVIRGLIDEMGRVSAGASAARLKTFEGLLEGLSALWKKTQDTLARGGAFDFAKEKLDELGQALERWVKDGTATRWGQSIGDALRTAEKEIRAFVSGAKEDLDGFRANLDSVTKPAATGWDVMVAGWKSVQQATELVAAGVAKVGAVASEGLAASGIAGEAASEKMRIAAETFDDAAGKLVSRANAHWDDAGAAVNRIVARYSEVPPAAEKALSAVEQAAADEAAIERERAAAIRARADAEAVLADRRFAAQKLEEAAQRVALESILTYQVQGRSIEELIEHKERLVRALGAEGRAAAIAAELTAEIAETQTAIAAAAKKAAEESTAHAEAVGRESSIMQANLAVQRDELLVLAERARRRGADVEALGLEIDARRREAEAIERAMEAKREEARILSERARLMRLAAEASGDVTTATRAEIDATADAARMAAVAADGAKVAAIAKRDAADAAAELHGRMLSLQSAFAEFGEGSIDSLEEVRLAIEEAADASELARLQDALESAFEAGALAAREYSALLAKIQGQIEGIGSGRRITGRAGIDFEEAFAQGGPQFGPGVDPGLQQAVLDEYRAWLREQAGEERPIQPGQPGFAAQELRRRAERQEAPAATTARPGDAALAERVDRLATSIEEAGRRDIVVTLDGYPMARAAAPYLARFSSRSV